MGGGRIGRDPLRALVLGALTAVLLGVPAGGAAAIPAAAEARVPVAESSATMGTRGPIPRVPRSFVGVSSPVVLWGSDADPSGAGTLWTIGRLGTGALRTGFLWSQLEPRPGEVDLTLYDGFMARAARAGMSVLPLLFDPPAHRSSRPVVGGARGTYPPASNREFAFIAYALVKRYGPNGQFWREHPELPYIPIRAWQVWNEPNLPQYWPAGPNPAAYAAMLRWVGTAIRAADPRAEVVTAGLNDSETGIPLSRFLRGMYAAGARGSFTSLGLHPYARTSTGVIDQVRRARALMRAKGDRASIRVTEFGWATGGPNPRRRVSEAAQAKLTTETVSRLLRLRRRFGITGLDIYTWRDAPPHLGGRDFWGLHTGLLTQDGRPKPVVFAMAKLLDRVVQR